MSCSLYFFEKGCTKLTEETITRLICRNPQLETMNVAGTCITNEAIKEISCAFSVCILCLFFFFFYNQIKNQLVDSSTVLCVSYYTKKEEEEEGNEGN